MSLSPGAQSYFSDIKPCNTSSSEMNKFRIGIEFTRWLGQLRLRSKSAVAKKKLFRQHCVNSSTCINISTCEVLKHFKL